MGNCTLSHRRLRTLGAFKALAEVVEHFGLTLQHVDQLGFLSFGKKLTFREKDHQVGNLQSRGTGPPNELGKFQLTRVSTTCSENSGDAQALASQAICIGCFPLGSNPVREISDAMSDLGCHFPYFEVFKTKVSHGRQLIGNDVHDKCGLTIFILILLTAWTHH